MLKRTMQDIVTAPDENPFLAIIRDPLTDLTRKHRSRLLGLSWIAIGIRLADVLPSQVSALGVSLSVADQKWFIRFLWISVLYLLGTFVVYAILDFWSWEANLKYTLQNFLNKHEGNRLHLDEAVDAAFGTAPVFLKADYRKLKVLIEHYVSDSLKGHTLIWRSSPMAALRLMVDLILPTLVSLLALLFLWTWSINPAQHYGTPASATQRSDTRVDPARSGRGEASPSKQAPGAETQKPH